MAASSSAELVLLLTESQSPHHRGSRRLVCSSRCFGEVAEVVDGGGAEVAEAGVATTSDPMEVDGGIRVGDAEAGDADVGNTAEGGGGGGAQQPSPATVFQIRLKQPPASLRHKMRVPELCQNFSAVAWCGKLNAIACASETCAQIPRRRQVPKSKVAAIVHQQAKPYCHISFICKESLACTSRRRRRRMLRRRFGFCSASQECLWLGPWFSDVCLTSSWCMVWDRVNPCRATSKGSISEINELEEQPPEELVAQPREVVVVTNHAQA